MTGMNSKRKESVYEILQNKSLDAILITSSENCYYLSGFTGTAGVIVITGERDYFITDFRYLEQAGEQVSGCEIKEISRNKEEKLAEFLTDLNISSLGFEDDHVSYEYYHKMIDLCEDITFVPLKGSVKDLRLIKEPEEIENIKKAVEITERAFDKLLDYIEPGRTEKELAAELEYLLRKEGGEKPAFDFIVASGKRSSLPHGVASDKKVARGEFITFDFGTHYNNYCSDMTRTVILGKPDEKQREVYEIVLQAHRQVSNNLRAGMSGVEADAIAREIITEAGYGDNFGHGLGHGIGIEIHEAPKLSTQSEDTLKPGMVVTNEPGIYISDWGGVRIEDDLLVEEDGCAVLNSSSKELIIL